MSFRLQDAAVYCAYLFRVQSRAYYGLGEGIQALRGRTTNSRKGRQMERRATIRARLPTPTLFHLHSILHGSHCTEDTMLQDYTAGTLATSSRA